MDSAASLDAPLAGTLLPVDAPGDERAEKGHAVKIRHALTLKVTIRLVASIVCTAVLFGGNAGAFAQDAPSGLDVRDVQTDGSSVTGWVLNQTSHEVRDVRLMVQQEFRWTREMQPGEDNPGSGTVVRVPQPIPAGGRVQFRYDMPAPLPQRADGHFETKVKVLSFSEHWHEPTAAAPQRAVVP